MFGTLETLDPDFVCYNIIDPDITEHAHNGERDKVSENGMEMSELEEIKENKEETKEIEENEAESKGTKKNEEDTKEDKENIKEVGEDKGEIKKNEKERNEKEERVNENLQETSRDIENANCVSQQLSLATTESERGSFLKEEKENKKKTSEQGKVIKEEKLNKISSEKEATTTNIESVIQNNDTPNNEQNKLTQTTDASNLDNPKDETSIAVQQEQIGEVQHSQNGLADNTQNASSKSDEESIDHHYFVEGNTKIIIGEASETSCAVCGGDTSKDTFALRCVWCKCTVHSACKSKLVPVCSYGRMQRFIVRPSDIVVKDGKYKV